MSLTYTYLALAGVYVLSQLLQSNVSETLVPQIIDLGWKHALIDVTICKQYKHWFVASAILLKHHSILDCGLDPFHHVQSMATFLHVQASSAARLLHS